MIEYANKAYEALMIRREKIIEDELKKHFDEPLTHELFDRENIVIEEMPCIEMFDEGYGMNTTLFIGSKNIRIELPRLMVNREMLDA